MALERRDVDREARVVTIEHGYSQGRASGLALSYPWLGLLAGARAARNPLRTTLPTPRLGQVP